MAEELWTIIGSFGERFAADTMAAFLTSKNIPCRLSEPSLTAPYSITLLVPNRLLGEMAKCLDWVPVAEYPDAASASVMAERLLADGIPADTDQPSRTNIGPFQLNVPRSLLHRAKKALSQPPISDDELTRLTLAVRAKRGRE